MTTAGPDEGSPLFSLFDSAQAPVGEAPGAAQRPAAPAPAPSARADADNGSAQEELPALPSDPAIEFMADLLPQDLSSRRPAVLALLRDVVKEGRAG